MRLINTGLCRVAALAWLAALAACGGSGPAGVTTAPCPRISILADGADLTRFRPGGPRDLSAMAVDARITGFQAQCDFASARRLDVRVTPEFAVERGPAATGRTVDLPWFLAVSTAEEEVLDRTTSSTRVTFPQNVGRAGAVGPTVRFTMPIGEGVRAQDYLVRIAFQLDADELAYNRTRGPR
ncbi:hypothetical protein [Falsiroseomonas sp. HW251]|uniref:hypothetical protein n=1 Tax=Falsiroseomonas sp. HW251 TaxID=3390998 RepID=UPI003D3121B0